MNALDFIENLLFWVGCAIATCALLGIGLFTAAVVVALFERPKRREPRWLGDTTTVDALEADQLESWFAMPAREPHR